MPCMTPIRIMMNNIKKKKRKKKEVTFVTRSSVIYWSANVSLSPLDASASFSINNRQLLINHGPHSNLLCSPCFFPDRKFSLSI